MDRKQVQRGLKALTIVAGILLLVFVVFEAGRIYGSISRLRKEANQLYPELLTYTYERAMRGEAASLRGDYWFSDETVTALVKQDSEFGPVEAFQLGYVESHILGVHHQFSVRVKRNGEWRDEMWYADELHGFFDMNRAEGEGRFSDAIKSPRSREFPLHEKGKD